MVSQIPEKLSVEDMFDELERESEAESREIEIVMNDSLERMAAGFEKVMEVGQGYYSSAGAYEMASPFAPQDMSAKDIEKFSLFLRRYQDEYPHIDPQPIDGAGPPYSGFGELVGPFLSALINSSANSKIKIHTKNLESSLDHIGQENAGREITVVGDVGEYLGSYMEEGRILVTGNAGSGVGYNITGGEIMVRGNALAWVGNQMRAGKVIIEGNCGLSVGYVMLGGEIHVNGDIVKVDEDSEAGMSGGIKKFPHHRVENGHIFHRGKQIYKSGRLVKDA